MTPTRLPFALGYFTDAGQSIRIVSYHATFPAAKAALLAWNRRSDGPCAHLIDQRTGQMMTPTARGVYHGYEV